MAGDETDAADAEIQGLQKRIGELREELAAARRRRPPEPVADYALTAWDGSAVRLSELFGTKRDLVVVHNMGARCPMCTLWADGLNGVRAHLEDRMAFAVSTPDTPDVQRAFAESRGWTFRMLSTRGTTFAKDLGFEGERDGEPFPWPGLSVFRRREDGGIERVASDGFGPGDDYCAMWSVMSLLPDGQGDWWPRLSYAR